MSKKSTKSVKTEVKSAAKAPSPEPQAKMAFPTTKPVDPITAPASAITSDATQPVPAKKKGAKTPKAEKPVKPAKAPKSSKKELSESIATGGVSWPFPQGSQMTDVVEGATPQPIVTNAGKKQLKQQAKLLKAQEKLKPAKAKLLPLSLTAHDADRLITCGVAESAAVIEVLTREGKKATLVATSVGAGDTAFYIPVTKGWPVSMIPASQARVCVRKTRDLQFCLRRTFSKFHTLTLKQYKAHVTPKMPGKDTSAK